MVATWRDPPFLWCLMRLAWHLASTRWSNTSVWCFRRLALPWLALMTKGYTFIASMGTLWGSVAPKWWAQVAFPSSSSNSWDVGRLRRCNATFRQAICLWYRICRLNFLVAALQRTPEAGANTRAHGQQLRRHSGQLEQLTQDIRDLKLAIAPPAESFVIRHRSTIAHKGFQFEGQNHPDRWRTPCGWRYGTARFFRVPVLAPMHSRCKKCFDLPAQDSSDSEEESEPDASSSSSSEDDGEEPPN